MNSLKKDGGGPNIQQWYNTVLLEIEELHNVAEEIGEVLDIENVEGPLSEKKLLNICNGLISSKAYISQASSTLAKVYEGLMGELPYTFK